MTPSKPYRVTVERDGQGWRLRVHGIGGPCTTHARDLADVEPRARKLVWAYTGIEPKDVVVDLDVRLPLSVHVRFGIAEQLVEEATGELEAAILELVEAGISFVDIDRIMRQRGQEPPRPLMISGKEIADLGLAMHPEATGIQWDDHGRFLTRICRECLVKNRPVCFEIDPDAECVLLYDSFTCHSCSPTSRNGDSPALAA